MVSYGFYPRFSPQVSREVNSLDPGRTFERQSDLRDLRELLWSSIDNWDSEDLDQIEYCEKGADGEIAIKVAIADVDVYVPQGSRTDRHAAHNGTSVYTGVETFPMLPDRLSKGISSLLPGQDRIAVVIEYTVLPGGDVRHGDIYRALVRNHAQHVYEEVGDWLEEIGPEPVSVSVVPGMNAQVRLQMEATARLRAFRMARGALDLETLEAQPVVEGGIVRDLVVQTQNAARSLIEEFMVAANETMVTRLGAAGMPMVQRVVRVPRHWDEIVDTAAKFGEHLPPGPDAGALSRFLTRRKEADPERFPDLSLTIVKLIGHGEYVAYVPGEDPIGHFALAVVDYTHSTAPNRRYVDIINQRLIKSVLDGVPSPYSPEELTEQADWLTGRDKASQKVERFMRKASAAVLLSDRIGELFEAFVTGVTEHGSFVRLTAPPAEGKVTEGDQGLRVGQKIRVRLLRTDPVHAHIDFARVGTLRE
ncbi:RNB domain-containing ribonuclease [Methanolinea mesophila]|uniref:RNB domain-containing ribonuclease n=1 Tax=Methanolinea mesophila TaxID=547055 RepID=UPI001FD77C38|nr:RNB domain-containing ribonuclease [Methanolinea mesophila]